MEKVSVPVVYSPHAADEPRLIPGVGIVCRDRKSLEPYLGETVRLREPAAAPAATLNTFDDDPCCSKPLSAFLRFNPHAWSWLCAKCGSSWTPVQVHGVRHWSATPVIEVFR